MKSAVKFVVSRIYFFILFLICAVASLISPEAVVKGIADSDAITIRTHNLF